MIHQFFGIRTKQFFIDRIRSGSPHHDDINTQFINIIIYNLLKIAFLKMKFYRNSQFVIVLCNLFQFLSLDFERSEEHTSELQSRENLVCRLLLEKKKIYTSWKPTLPPRLYASEC